MNIVTNNITDLVTTPIQPILPNLKTNRTQILIGLLAREYICDTDFKYHTLKFNDLSMDTEMYSYVRSFIKAANPEWDNEMVIRHYQNACAAVDDRLFDVFFNIDELDGFELQKSLKYLGRPTHTVHAYSANNMILESDEVTDWAIAAGLIPEHYHITGIYTTPQTLAIEYANDNFHEAVPFTYTGPYIAQDGWTNIVLTNAGMLKHLSVCMLELDKYEAEETAELPFDGDD